MRRAVDSNKAKVRSAVVSVSTSGVFEMGTLRSVAAY